MANFANLRMSSTLAGLVLVSIAVISHAQTSAIGTSHVTSGIAETALAVGQNKAREVTTSLEGNANDVERNRSLGRKYVRSTKNRANLVAADANGSAGQPINSTQSASRKVAAADEELVDLREDYLATLRGWEEGQPFDYAARSRAIDFTDAQRVGLPNTAGASPALIQLLTIPTWTELGPMPIPNGSTQSVVSAVSGRVTAIEIDPLDPNKVYVGTAQGGVYRSLNGGSIWTPIFDSAQSLAIGALALDAANGRLYVGTGEANGSADSFGGVGLYRIDNVNTSATLVGPINPVRTYLDAASAAQSVAVFTGRSISKILIVPNDPTTLLVGVAGGVIGIGGDPPFGGSVPPLGVRGLYKLTSVTGAPASVSVTRISVGGNVNQGCFDTPCTGNRNLNDMVFDPADLTGNTLIVWLNGINQANDGGIWRTTNAITGAPPTFAQTFATTSTSASNGRGALAIYKQGANPAVVYVASGEPSIATAASPGATLCNSGTQPGALRRSVDGGVTFSAKLPGGGGFCGGQCFYNIALAVLPGTTTATSDDKILLGGNIRGAGTPSACQKLQGTSLDGGATVFADTDVGLHADSHAITIAPSNPLIVYRGDDGGIWKSIDGGLTWVSLNNATFRATQFIGLSVHPTDPNFTIGGTQDNGTNQLLASGSAWNRIDFGDGGFALIDQNATNTSNVTMYHTYFNQTNNFMGFGRVLSNACASSGFWAFKGIYGGIVSPSPYCDGSTDTFNGIALTDPVNFYAPMALGPGNPNTVYFGSNKLYRSANKGDTMPAVSQTMTANVSSIAISPQDDNYRLVGLNNGGLFFTTTGSSTLISLDPVAGGARVIPAKYVGRVLFDPTNKNTAYVGLGGYMAGTTAALSHVWKVTNLSTTPLLTAINTGLPDVPVNALAVDPLQPLRLFVGTDIGVFVSADGGTSWAPFGTGLPNVAVFGMEIQNIKRVLRIATHGRGMWEISLDPITTYTVTPSASANGNISPNTAVTVNQGATTTFTVTPNVGFATTVGGTCGGSLLGNVYTTLAITANCTVLAQFVSKAANDLSGDGKSDLLLQAGVNGTTSAYLMNGTSITSSAALIGGGSGWSITHTADFNGDGRADIVWQHTDGTVVVWLMNGTTLLSGGALLSAGSGWSVSHTADVNGDGKADLLWKHTDGTVAVWLMDGLNLISGAGLLGAGSGWSLSHTADLNGDGRADLLWKHSDGTVAAWLMDGINVTDGSFLLGAGSGWSLSHTADLNGDGRADLLWKHSDGTAAAWLMNGINVTGGSFLLGAGSGWSVTHTADLSGDGRADLLWKHTDGTVAVWLMNGLTLTSGGDLLGAGSGWSVARTGDFNGDGKADLVWRHTNGSIVIWLMDGITLLGGGAVVGAGTTLVVP